MNPHKSHSRLDLIELINTINIPVVFSHVDTKKDIQKKVSDLMNSKKHKPITYPNVYKIKTYTDLKVYLEKPNPKKQLSVKEKKDIMKICKHIIFYCKQDKILAMSDYYNDYQQIKDDMDYIKQWGDIPSVRRCCKLMNKGLSQDDKFIPLISPQVQLKINEKIQSKPKIPQTIKIRRDDFVVVFE